MFTKLLYILNAGIQFFLLNKFFGAETNSTMWGMNMVSDLLHGREWHDSGYFPRVTLCDFTVRELGNLHSHTVQCVLMINMLNEKIYVFLWFWLAIVALATCLNFAYWFYTLTPLYCRYNFVVNYLRIAVAAFPTYSKDDKAEFQYGLPKFNPDESSDDRRLAEKFTSRYLRLDGALLMRFISNHSGDVIVAELMIRLYDAFLHRKPPQSHPQPTMMSTNANNEPALETIYRCNETNNGYIPLQSIAKSGFVEVITSCDNGGGGVLPE